MTILLGFIGSAPLWAQSQLYKTQIQSAIEKMRDSARYESADVAEWKISNQFTDPQTKLTYSYIQQYYLGIPVYNAVGPCVIAHDEIVYFQPVFVTSLASRIAATSASITPRQAVEYTLQALQKSSAGLREADEADSIANQYSFLLPNIASSPIRVSAVWQSKDNRVYRCWNVSIELRAEPHWWNYRIDANTGEWLDKNDYVTSCTFDAPQSNPTTNSLVTPPVYHIFPFPIEAPNYGPRSLLTDPSDPFASPYAWHDTNAVAGEEFTYTRGNNVYAYEDANNDNLPGYSPNAGSSMGFNYSFTNGASVSANQNTAITNLFYACNRVHDYLYNLGFTELAGNFQQNNYGQGGMDNDAVLAEAQDGSGTNNANFATPPDGSSGRMQMYLWTGNNSTCSNLTLSGALVASPSIGTADFSAVGSVTANVVLVNDGVAPLTDGCSSILNNVVGKVALIDRGTCAYINKAVNAQNAGALAVIIVNNVSGAAPNMSGSPLLSIPCVSVSLADGNAIKAALQTGTVTATINTCIAPPIDACFDNGIIAHEYGHGLSNRLTGGAANVGCLNNAENGSEGWSDWLSLMMTMKAGDIGSTPRGIGNYAIGATSTGAGIRRYPYSTNMSINPQTYATLASSSQIHNVGEIWCDVLWDMSWLLVNNYGFSSNPNNASAGNNIAMRLVLEGMKLQPCNPGFIDARNAILTAETILYGNVHRCLLWQAFAGRGMGFGASQGSANVVGDEVQSFTLPPFCLPATQAPVAAFTADSLSILCGGRVQFTDQSTAAFNWHWNFGDSSTSILQNPSHTYTAPGTYVVKLKVDNPLGQDSITHVITVTPAFSVNITAAPTTICASQPVALQAVASGSNNRSYTYTSIPYAPLNVAGNNLNLGDDQITSALPIGFTFSFFGQNYTNFYLCSNGFITFSSGMPATNVYGQALPSLSLPLNLIALCWNDLNPQNPGGNINYITTGIAPNRKLVINYNCTHYLSTSSPFVVQAILFEGSNQIEIHTTQLSNVSALDPNAFTTQGIENLAGTIGLPIPGKNATHSSSFHESWRFTPYVPYTYSWNPGLLNGAIQTVTPTSSQVYTLTVSDGTACSATYTSPAITVTPCPITLNLQALHQGYYLGGGLMQPVLQNQGVSTNLSLCDTLTIALHEATPPYSQISESKALWQVNGQASCSFTILPGNYYIELRHRSGLETWSASPVSFAGTSVLYNFTNAANKAYASNQVEVQSGIWAMYAGDLYTDGNVDLLDYSELEYGISNFLFGYESGDINGDGNVDLLDSSILETNVMNFVYSILP